MGWSGRAPYPASDKLGLVRLVRPLKLTGVHGYRWTLRLGVSVAERFGILVPLCHLAEKAVEGELSCTAIFYFGVRA